MLWAVATSWNLYQLNQSDRVRRSLYEASSPKVISILLLMYHSETEKVDKFTVCIKECHMICGLSLLLTS